MKSLRKAFTLIELLVVIAIIAILAAILFPVFAQAKAAAKKASTLSNAKQTGTAITIYTTDQDDLFPAGTVPDLAASTPGVIRYRSTANAALVPAGWNGDAALRAEHELIWANAIQPYMKNLDMLDMTGSRRIAPAASIGNPATATPRPVGVNFAFNGLLQYLSTTDLAAVSRVTMLWQGMGDETTEGLVWLTPRLRCAGTGVCRFNAGGQPQADNPAGFPQQFTLTLTAKFHTFSRGNIHVFGDTSARLVNYARGNASPFPSSTNSSVPYQFFTEDGRIPSAAQWAFRGMGPLRGANYAAAFCPDNTFGN